jgi:hypothetical protein
MSTGALLFMLGAWAVVLGLTFWSFRRLLKADSGHEPLPPPGTSL